MAKFKKSDIVAFREGLSETGRYAKYLKNRLRITQVNNYYNVTYSVIVLSDDDKILANFKDVSERSLVPSVETNSCSGGDFSVESTKKLIDSLQEKVNKLKERIDAEYNKLDFLESNNIESATFNEYNAYKILRIASDSTISELDRARAIAAIISNK